ncbi:putative carbonic anhydrase-like protein 1 [Frieseomelitta varia]|uniref:putative carbonic anhydrase-like protein 1 n=1 Tax=Frieseomelitta varia TaxID=561572 RepID=UPI001CB6AE1C|nr:putative carbonic anhydrase-like protein 1 [Frieseomelitta varia]
MGLLRHLLLCLLGVIVIVNESEASWDEWWTYDGISGPSFWGLINPQWSLCSKGRRQSPINIEPDKLLFDRHLRPVVVDKHKVIYPVFLNVCFFFLLSSFYSSSRHFNFRKEVKKPTQQQKKPQFPHLLIIAIIFQSAATTK